MATFPKPFTPHEFNLEHANRLGVEFFDVIVTTLAGSPTAWDDLNRELPVRLFLLDGKPALHWWSYVRGQRGRARSEQQTAVFPSWLWELLEGSTTADEIRTAGRAYGIFYPTRKGTL